MVRTASTMLPLGTTAPSFSLPDVIGKTVSLQDFAGKPALLVIFMCNHCPFVKHVADGLAKLAREYQAKGVAVVGHQLQRRSDVSRRRAGENGRRGQGPRLHFSVPVRRNPEGRAGLPSRLHAGLLRVRRQAATRLPRPDGRQPARQTSVTGGIPVTGADLRAALDAVLSGKSPADDQKPSIGCNIKWQRGQRAGLLQVGPWT